MDLTEGTFNDHGICHCGGPLRLDTIVWILKNITTIAVTAFLVVFQPELRKALNS